MDLISRGDLACSEVRDLADAYIDRELFTETNMRMLRHMWHCDACLEGISWMARLKLRVHDAARQMEIPAGLERGLRRAIGLS